MAELTKKYIPGLETECAAIVMGGVHLGTRLDEAASYRLLDQYADAGGNMVDTAEVYGNWVPGKRNMSEIVIGNWMKERGNRGKMIVTTKGGHPELSSMNVSRLRPADIRADAEGSLRRLRTDVIDLYWLHRDDRSIPVAELIGPLTELAREGLIRRFGCSNWAVDRIAAAQAYAEAAGQQPFSANQAWWSLAAIDRDRVEDRSLVLMDEAMYRVHAETKLPFFAYSSQAQGLFAKMEAAERAGAAFEPPAVYGSPDNARRYRESVQIAQERSATVSQIALAYILSRPFPAFAVIGASSAAQLQDSLGAGALTLSAQELARLDGGAFGQGDDS